MAKNPLVTWINLYMTLTLVADNLLSMATATESVSDFLSLSLPLSWRLSPKTISVAASSSTSNTACAFGRLTNRSPEGSLAPCWPFAIPLKTRLSVVAAICTAFPLYAFTWSSSSTTVPDAIWILMRVSFPPDLVLGEIAILKFSFYLR